MVSFFFSLFYSTLQTKNASWFAHWGIDALEKLGDPELMQAKLLYSFTVMHLFMAS